MSKFLRLVGFLIAMSALSGLNGALAQDEKIAGYKLDLDLFLDGQLVASPTATTDGKSGVFVFKTVNDQTPMKMEFMIEDNANIIARQFNTTRARIENVTMLSAKLYVPDPSNNDSWVVVSSPSMTLERTGKPTSSESTIARNDLSFAQVGIMASIIPRMIDVSSVNRASTCAGPEDQRFDNVSTSFGRPPGDVSPQSDCCSDGCITCCFSSRASLGCCSDSTGCPGGGCCT